MTILWKFIKNNWMKIIVFVVSIVNIVEFYDNTYDRLYISAPDTDLYWSISDNLFANGHFIQNFYPETPDFVVPFGLPVIILLLKLIVNDIWFVVVVQYILFGITEVLLFEICKTLFKNSLAGICASILYFQGIILNPICGPAYILTETYTMFLLVLACYVLALDKMKIEKKLIAINIILFIGYVIRPALSVIFYVSLVWSLIFVLRKKISIKKFITMVSAFVVIIVINTLVNYREIREWVVLENYSAYSIYLANNSNTQTIPWGSDLYPYFLDDYGMDIKMSDLTMEQKDKLYTAGAKEFISKNIIFCIQNACVKYKKLFLDNFGWRYVVMWIGAVVCLAFSKTKRYCYISYIVTFLMLSIITSFGLNVSRYAIIALPFIAIFIAGLIGMPVGVVCNKILNYMKHFVERRKKI